MPLADLLGINYSGEMEYEQLFAEVGWAVTCLFLGLHQDHTEKTHVSEGIQRQNWWAYWRVRDSLYSLASASHTLPKAKAQVSLMAVFCLPNIEGRNHLTPDS